MSDYFIDTPSFWALMNQVDDGVNPIDEMFPEQKNQTGQTSGLGERLASRTNFNPPRLETGNTFSFASLFRNSNDMSSPVVAISPGFSPSALLQSPNMLSNPSEINPPFPVANADPQAMVESCGESDPTTMMPETDLPYDEPMNVHLPPPQEGSNGTPTEESHVEPLDAPLVAPSESEVVDHNDGIDISVEEETEEGDDDDEDDDKDYYDDDEDEDENEYLEEEKYEVMVDEQDVKPPSPKRRKYEMSSNMVGASRASKTQRIIIQMISDESHPNDGFRWRKYGQKVVKGNPNPRSYYKCTHEGCEVKKLVERGAEDINIVVTTYDGVHQHYAPAPRSNGPKTRVSPAMVSDQDQTDGNMLPSSVYETSGPVEMDMSTHLYMTGLSKLPSIPVHQNNGFMNRNNEPRVNAMPHGANVFMNRPSLPVHQNTGFMYRNGEPSNDAMPNGMNVLLNQPSLPVHQNNGFMYPNAEPRINAMPIGTSAAMNRPSLPVHQNTGFMYGIDVMPTGINVLSMPPSLPVQQDTGFVNRNDEPTTPNGSSVYRGIMNRVFVGFGARFGY